MNIRQATRTDLEQIIALLADDKLGKKREDYRLPLPELYVDAFSNIEGDPNQELMVLAAPVAQVTGVFQLTVIPYLTYRGGIRAQIEGVRIHRDFRGQGLGRKMFEWAIERAKQRKAHVLQLTTDKKRPEALKFYRDLGFVDSHEGMKLHF